MKCNLLVLFIVLNALASFAQNKCKKCLQTLHYTEGNTGFYSQVKGVIIDTILFPTYEVGAHLMPNKNFYFNHIEFKEINDSFNYNNPVVGINGNLYLFPRINGRILEFIPSTNTINYLNYLSAPNNGLYLSTIAHSNGLIYSISSFNNDKMLTFDPITKEVKEYHLTDYTSANFTMVEYLNYIYLFPFGGSESIYKYNILTNELIYVMSIGVESGADFHTAYESPSGVVYLIPFKSKRVGRFDLATETFSLIGQTFPSQNDKWAGSRYNPLDSCIYAAPFSRGTILKINTKTEEISEIPSPVDVFSKAYWTTTIGANGLLYFPPSSFKPSYDDIMTYNPASNKFGWITHPLFDDADIGYLTTIPDGRMIGIDISNSKLIILTPGGAKIINDGFLFGSHNNKR